MRFHKFDDFYFDLDAICGARGYGYGQTQLIVAGGWTHIVAMPLEDVLALISPPAAPDTHKEELAKLAAKKLYGVESDEWNALWQITTRRDEEWRQARLNELTWMACRVMTWAKGGADLMLRHIAERRAEIEQERG